MIPLGKFKDHPQVTEEKRNLDETELWDLRRRNLSAIIAFKRTNAKQVSEKAGLSVNTVSKFVRGETNTLRWSSLEKICQVLELPNASVLDEDNPLSSTKSRLYELIKGMSEEQAKSLLDELE